MILLTYQKKKKKKSCKKFLQNILQAKNVKKILQEFPPTLPKEISKSSKGPSLALELGRHKIQSIRFQVIVEKAEEGWEQVNNSRRERTDKETTALSGRKGKKNHPATIVAPRRVQ